MTRLLSMICSAAVMLAASSTVFAQTKTTNSNMNNGSCNKPKEECAPCKPVCKPCCFFEQGMALDDDVKPPCDVKYHPGYNASAAIKVGCSWDFNVDASFIYWNVNQDAMDITHVAPVATLSGVTAHPGSVVKQSTGYKPGFKVGLGWDTNFDNWNLNAEYTWLHETQTGSATATTAAPFVANDLFPATIGGTFTGASSSWQMHMDMVDALVSRPFYEGTHLTVSPSAGLRGLWIRQALTVDMTGATAATSANTSHSWAVGPKACVNTHWMVWDGLRFDGVMGASVLYTRYTSVANSETSTVAGATSSVSSTSGSFSAVRPTVDMGLGLGYGMYAYSNKFFFDLAVRYDFSQFWSQNVIRNFASQLVGRDDAIGDLHMHGLTITLRCDF